MVMEAEKPHNLPSVSWRNKKVNILIQPESQGPKIHGSQWCNSQSVSVTSNWWTTDGSPEGQRSKNLKSYVWGQEMGITDLIRYCNGILLFFFILFRFSTYWMILPHISEGNLSFQIQMLISPRNIFTVIPRNNT